MISDYRQFSFRKMIKHLLMMVIPRKMIIWRGEQSAKNVAISFDDGPHPVFTPLILDILAKYEVKATFFIIGQHAETYPDLLKRIVDEGHELGNHTLRHNNFQRGKLINPSEEIYKSQAIFNRIVNRKPVLFRPPYGIISLGLLWNVMINRLTIAMWSLDSEDSKGKSEAEIRKNLNDEDNLSGQIILFHDKFRHTVDLLEDVILKINKLGLKFTTISAMINNQLNVDSK